MARVSGGMVKLEREVLDPVKLEGEEAPSPAPETLVDLSTLAIPLSEEAIRASKPNAAIDDDDACIARWFVS